MLLHIQVQGLDRYASPSGLWQRLTLETRVLSVLSLVCAIALTPNGSWWTWGIYAVAGAVFWGMARVSWRRLGQRLALEGIFVATMGLGTLFMQQGTPIWQWGWFQVTQTGWTIFVSVMLKAVLSLIILNILVLTTPTHSLLSALKVLRIPPLLIDILSSMSRYITVLMDEFQVMQRAAAARNLTGVLQWRRLMTGNMIGALFIRTYERGDRIYQAMLARGYRGTAQLEVVPSPLTWLDQSILVIVGSWILLGQLVRFAVT